MDHFKIKRSDLIELMRLIECFVEHCRLVFDGNTVKAICATKQFKTRMKTSCTSNGNGYGLNIPDVGKFLRVLRLVSADEMTFTVERDRLHYFDDKINFVYYLADDIIIKNEPLDEQRMDNNPFDATVVLTTPEMKRIMACSSVLGEKNTKIYFEVQQDREVLKLVVGDRESKKSNSLAFNYTLKETAKKTVSPSVLFELFQKIPAVESQFYIAARYVKVEYTGSVQFTIVFVSNIN